MADLLRIRKICCMPRGCRIHLSREQSRASYPLPKPSPWLTIADMREAARQRNGWCLSPHYRYAPAKLKWRCAEGHEFSQTGLRVRHGYWCPACRNRINIAQLREVAKKRGGRCLSIAYDPHGKTRWECERGHRFERPGAEVRRGKWCPVCARNQITIAELRDLANGRGGRLLSRRYRPRAKLEWRCSRGHAWTATGHAVRRGTWCPDCAWLSLRLTTEDMHRSARRRGGFFRSSQYRPRSTKLLWECRKGHAWRSTAFNVRQGSWCPYCAGRLLTLEQVGKLARDQGFTLVRYREHGSKARLRCQQGHAFEKPLRALEQRTLCPQCSPAARIRIGDLKRIAREHGGRCVSDAYRPGADLQWECANGHGFSRSAYLVRQGRWCPHLDCARRLPRTLDAARTLARRRGGRCLSSRYEGFPRKMRWACERGHEWSAPVRSVRGGTWCPTCARERQGNPRDTTDT